MRGRNVAAISRATSSSAPWSRPTMWAGQHITLRTTSPQALRVVTRCRLSVPISGWRSFLWTKWYCRPWRVVMRRLPSATSSARASAASHWSGDSTPPGTLVRTMHW